MRAVVLVGGEGTRLRPLTFTTPKQLLPVAGVPIIERVIGHLAGHGVEQVVLSMGYRPDAFLAAYPDGRCAGVAVVYAVEPEPRGTAGAIRFAAEFAGVADTFVVVNGDVLTDLDVAGLVAFHVERGAAATVALTPVDDPSAFGVVTTDDDGRVEAFIEKPPRDEAPTNLINAGTYVMEPEVLALIPSTGAVSVERETFPALVEQRRLYALATPGYWVDAGTPATYLRANLDLLGDRPDLVDGCAVVEPGARVEHSVVAAGAAIRHGASVVDSVVLEGADVGRDAMVRRCIVAPGAVVPAGAQPDELTIVG